MNNKYVLYILSNKIPPDYAGGGKRAYKLYEKFRNNGINTKIITTTNNNNLNIYTFKLYKTKYSNKIVNNIVNTLLLPIMFIRLIIFYYRAKTNENNKTNKYILHIIGLYSWFSILSIIAAKINGYLIVSENTRDGSDDPETVKHSYLGSLKYNIITRSDYLISKSKVIDKKYDHCINNSNHRCVIGNPVDYNMFEPKISNSNKKYEISIGIIGVIRPRKRQYEIIKMLYDNISCKDRRIIIYLIGPYDKDSECKIYYNKIKNYIKNKKIDNVNVVFTGNIDNVSEYMAKIDVLLFASLSEGMPNTILESMSSQNLVITTEINGVAYEIIDNKKNGIIVTNINDMYRHIDNYMYNKKKYTKIKKEARKEIIKNHSFKKIIDKYLNIYNTIIK